MTDDRVARILQMADCESGFPVPEEPSWSDIEEHLNEEPTSPLDKFLSLLITDEDMERRPPPEYLIDGMLVRDSLGAIYGASGSGKTFVALSWALSVATGSWWQGRRVVKGPVLFVAAEGSGGLGARIAAWKAHNRFQGDAGLMVLPEPVCIMDPLTARVVGEACLVKGAVLVVIDTVARSMPGGDENTAKDIGRLVDGADAIRRRSGACVLFVHHTGKDQSAGMRGNSALHAAVATVIECKGGDSHLVLEGAKQKDDLPFPPIHLGLFPVGASCVAAERSPDSDELPPGAVELLRVLDEIADEDGVSSSVWRASTTVAERSFYRWQKQLVEGELAAKSGARAQARYTIAEQGKRLLAKKAER